MPESVIKYCKPFFGITLILVKSSGNVMITNEYDLKDENSFASFNGVLKIWEEIGTLLKLLNEIYSNS